MGSVIRIQYALPNGQYLDKLLTDDLILRYVKDGYVASEHCFEYYDTDDWALAEAGFSLGVTRAQELPVAVLRAGRVDGREFPGLYRGWEITAPYIAPSQAASALLERGAPPAFAACAENRDLARCFFSIYASRSTTLYLPERTRVEMRFDSGELVAGDKRQPFYELGLTLLFGDERLLTLYCEQIQVRFALPPVLLSRQQAALRLIRTR